MSLFLKRWSALEKSRADRFLESYSMGKEKEEALFHSIKDSRLGYDQFLTLYYHLQQEMDIDESEVIHVINDILEIYPSFMRDIVANFDFHSGRRNTNSIVVKAQDGRNELEIMYLFDRKSIFLYLLWLESELRDAGIAKKIFQKLIPFCLKYKMEKIEGITSWIGRYTWGRFGFTAQSHVLTAQKKFLKMLYLGNANSMISPIKHTAEIAAARLRVTDEYIAALKRKRKYKRMWKLLLRHIVGKNSTFWLNNEFLIGKWSLLGGDPMDNGPCGIEYPIDLQSWPCLLDLSDGFSTDLLRRYIGLTESEDQDIDASFWRDMPNAISIEVTDDLDDDITERINENLFFSSQDTIYNWNHFLNSDNGKLFVTGYTGSGKSTTAQELALRYKIPHIQLDSYIPIDKVYVEHQQQINTEESTRQLQNYFQSQVDKTLDELINSSSKYIIEGIQIFLYSNPDKFQNHSVVIKGTSVLLSAIRAFLRNIKSDWASGWSYMEILTDIYRNLFIKKVKSFLQLVSQWQTKV